MNSERLAAIRAEYRGAGLAETDLDASPVDQFTRWLEDARAAELPEPNAMVLSTASADGRPSVRHVLLKEYDEDARFVFYTNLTSQKARELTENPAAAIVFPWSAIARQVIVSGLAEPVSREEAAAYFATRPRGAQLGAWTSRQSQVIPSRAWLDERLADAEARYPDDVPLPDFWGGFRVVAETVEFWQGRENRLHDRLRYRRTADGWAIERLSP